MLKNLQAYWTGRFGCNDLDSKILSPKIFSYNKKQLECFVKGVLRSRRCIQLSNGEVIYISNSIVYLNMLQSVFKKLNIKTNIVSTSIVKYMTIYYNDIDKER